MHVGESSALRAKFRGFIGAASSSVGIGMQKALSMGLWWGGEAREAAEAGGWGGGRGVCGGGGSRGNGRRRE